MHPFPAHLDLFETFLTRRDDIVERLQGLLNAQRHPTDVLRDRALLSRHVENCFFIGATHDQSLLRGHLEAAHWATGFKPRDLPGLYNGLADPGEMTVRAFHLWQQTRWPGRNGRVHYAHTLFNLYALRYLELLTMRLWDDDGGGGAGEWLSQIQAVLDRLWKTSPAGQPRLVRDARWLIQLAQSPATDDLGAYFEVARRVADTLPEPDRLEVCTAGVRMTGGHLRSQIRYHSLKKGVPLDEESLVRNTRNTNALDFALLVQELVPLLAAYEAACAAGDREARLALADSICQGVSPDPDLFINRVELLGAYSMIEHLCITTDGDGHAAYTPMGRRHVHLLQEYEERLGRVSKPLSDDCAHFKPVTGTYSPYGALYGFASNLVEHMAFKTLQADAVTRFGLEDVFTSGESDKLAWVNGWRKLPHLARDVEAQFDYPQPFADDVFARIERALRRTPAQTGHLVIVSDDASDGSLLRPESYDEAQLLSDRREGRCLLSYQTPNGWVAISKGVLTDVLAAGRDASLGGLPPAAADVLRLLYPRLVRPPG